MRRSPFGTHSVCGTALVELDILDPAIFEARSSPEACLDHQLAVLRLGMERPVHNVHGDLGDVLAPPAIVTVDGNAFGIPAS